MHVLVIRYNQYETSAFEFDKLKDAVKYMGDLRPSGRYGEDFYIARMVTPSIIVQEEKNLGIHKED